MARTNPYPGTRAFGTGDHDGFFGRGEEVEILTAMVLARRASLLFAPSGAGKSSLIQAGLIPELTRSRGIGRGQRRSVRRMAVLPVTGVGGGMSSRLGREPENVFVFQALYGLTPDIEPDELVDRRLADGVAPLIERIEDAGEVPMLLVIDQFEELFTRHTARWRERLPFFEQLVETLERHDGLH